MENRVAYTWQQNYWKRRIHILNGQQIVGQLGYESLLGSTASGHLLDQHFRFTTSGFFQVRMDVHDSKTGQTLGEVRLNHWKSGAEFSFNSSENQLYSWKPTSIWYNEWIWKTDTLELIKFRNQSTFFTDTGSIQFEPGTHTELLILLGLYLRQYYVQIASG